MKSTQGHFTPSNVSNHCAISQQQVTVEISLYYCNFKVWYFTDCNL